MAAGVAVANPVDGTVVGGSAVIAASGNTLNVTQSSDRAVIDWRGFDIGAGETTAFHQPSANAVAINRVTMGGASRIDGNLTANGNVVIINQNGVLFGAGSQVDVNGLVASTADISTASAMAGGPLVFGAPGNASATIANAGTITAKDAGLVGFVAPNVVNSGVITAKLGRVHLASGDTATVDLYGDGLMSVAVSDAVSSQLVSNTGTIQADGGTIALTAAAGANIVNSLITNSGTLRAQSVGDAEGAIIISAASANGSGGVVDLTGTLDVSGSNGGTVSITGRNIAQQSTIIADGSAGTGGTVTIAASGSYIDSAQASIMARGTTDAASLAAGATGQGGDITVTADTRLFSSGMFDTSGTLGGTITLSSDGGDVSLYGVHLTASGTHGGGSIRLGGGAAGNDPTVCNAENTKVNFSSVITADALVSGNGGSVTFWGDGSLGFAGTATAKGGSGDPTAGIAAQGNGGRIEISAGATQPFIATTASINASATNGTAGTLLYDPKNITIATGGNTGLVYFELVDPNAADVANHTFGTTTVLSTGNIVIAVSDDDFAASGAGAVYLFNGATGALISTLRGSQASDSIGNGAITALTGNGNYVVNSIGWDNGTITEAGAATWGSGTAGVSGVISSSNSLVGSTVNDSVGNTGSIALSNGNYVVGSYTWANGTVTNAGAVTWGNGTVGISGVISSTNSLVGSKANDSVGNYVITVLTNGNYVVSSDRWDSGTVTDAGAATWGSGTVGVSGVISSTNSLIGSTASDQVGQYGVVALTNGNYVIGSGNWDNGTVTDAGAVTWGSGTVGISGVISSTNSLVGSKASDSVGGFSIIALSNGNYVVSSFSWDSGTVVDAGAVTWGNGTVGISGVISSTNSLVGSKANDSVGNYGTSGGHVYGGVTDLSNGNYVVASTVWDNGTVSNAGAVTWGSATVGISGVISSTNSLVGSKATDLVGNGGITVLTNGNYVVGSTVWDNGTITNAGAATWGSGTVGVSGVISSTNSLVGSKASDGVSNSGITVLSNGNYVVGSYTWDNGTITNAGAATWGSGTVGVSGVISSTNSLIGSKLSDSVGNSGITALSNGNYVVGSYKWDNGTITDAGAATWGSGTVGVNGVISSTNSLVGSTANDGVSDGGSTLALSNGDYVVPSGDWDYGTAIDAGAVTWGSGSAGISGVITNTNSIIGPSASSGLGAIVADTINGNYIAYFYTAGRGYVAPISGDGKPFSDVSGGSLTLDPTFLTATLNTGTSLTLQANNDITVTNAITVNNGSGNGGVLTLQAGRSILLNANITTDDGNLFLYANEKASAGVVDAYRDAGAAAITMGSGTSINAGSGAVSIRLDNGSGNTNSTAGDITLRDITASSILVQTTASTSDITIASGATLTASGAGNALTLASGRNFLNSATTPFALSGGGRWLVYSANPASNTLNSLTGDFNRYSCSYSTAGSCSGGTIIMPGSGNGLLYSYTPTLTITPSALSALTYGDAAPSLTGYSYGVTGYLAGEGTDTVLGSLTGTTDYDQGDNVGSYYVNYSSGTLTSALGYGISSYANNATAITVGQRAITITAGNQSQTYGVSHTLTGGYSVTSGSLVSGEAITGGVSLSTNATDSTSGNWNYNATPWTITATGTPTGTGGFTSGNYAVTFATGSLTIARKTLTVTATGVNKGYDGTTTGTVTLGDDRITNDVFTSRTYTAATFADANVANGIAVHVTGIAISGGDAGNYSLAATTADTTANITQRAITITAGNQSQTYGDSHTLTGGYSVTSGSLVSGEAITGGVSLSTNATDSTSGNWNYNATPWTITATGTPTGTGGFTSGNYAVTFATGSLTIARKTLTVSATGVNKGYDGTTTGTVTLGDDRITNDVFTSRTYTAATFADANVANGIAVHVTGIAISGGDAGNYSLAATTADTTANIIQRAITVTATNQSITYGDTHTLSAGYSVTSGSLVSGEAITGGVSLSTNATESTSGNWNYNATPWTITANGTPTGTGGFAAGNYAVTFATGSLTIARKTLTVSATGVNKGYDGTTTGTVTLGDDRITNDVFTSRTYTAATFADPNVASGIAVHVTGIAISGGDAGNYSPAATTADTTANITQRAITITAGNQSQTYGVSHTLTGGYSVTSGSLVSGEAITGGVSLSTNATDSTSGHWNYNATPWTITATGTPTGTGGFTSGNYAVTFATGSLTIARKTLTVSATGTDRGYDGTTATTATLGDDRIGGDLFSDSYGVASFADAGAAAGKTVTVTGIAISGADAANYSLAATTASTTATIAKQALTVTAGSQTITADLAVPASSSLSYSGFISGEDASFLTTAPTVTSARSGLVTAGTYAGNYTAAGGIATNYSFSYLPGDLTVTAAAVTTDNTSTLPNTVIRSPQDIPTDFTRYNGWWSGIVLDGFTWLEPTIEGSVTPFGRAFAPRSTVAHWYLPSTPTNLTNVTQPNSIPLTIDPQLANRLQL